MISRSHKLSLVILAIIIATTFTLNPEKKIVENIKVEEWIVPIYAVDARGNSVTDLSSEEIELHVNGKEILNFNFLKKTFFIGKRKKSDWFRNREEEKVIVLVFDTALSKSPSIMKSKAIAEQLVARSGLDTRFILFKIEGFFGLSYLGGPTKDKKRISNIINNDVISIDNTRSVSSGVDDSESEKSKYQHDEQTFFFLQQTKYLSHKSSQFASSFQSLYYAITNITGTKFIYLFSEGLSNSSWRRGDTHASKMAGHLLRSGAVLFFINPAGGRGSNLESGEEFLRVLSSLSGGKYLTGDTRSINDNIINVHKAYYELTFRDPEEGKGGMLRIDARSKRKNVNIHTIRNLERSKGYLGLNDFEKRLAILNMISKNPIFKLPVEVDDAKIVKEETKSGKIIYEISIPEHFRDHNLDFYKIQISDSGEKPTIRKDMIKTGKPLVQVSFENKTGFNNYFALINSDLGLALIKGVEKNSIKILTPSFKTETISFGLTGFSQKEISKKKVGLLRIAIKILDRDGKVVKSDEKEITVVKSKTTLRIPVRKIKPGKYNILLIAKDMISGEETNEVLEVNIK